MDQPHLYFLKPLNLLLDKTLRMHIMYTAQGLYVQNECIDLKICMSYA